jgi:hypothetical protein
MDDLVRIFKLDSLSLSDDELTAIKARMAHPEALDRLCRCIGRRRRLAAWRSSRPCAAPRGPTEVWTAEYPLFRLDV